MAPTIDNNSFVALSDAMVEAVAKAGTATVLVNARQRMPASGVVYAADLILTADHVVEQEDSIKVLLADGTEIPARLVGRDPTSDLAVLRLERPAAAVAEPAPEDARVGQLVLALGRPSEGGIEASLGVVSAAGGPVRTRRGGLLERYLRTDTIPYPGFSGGPLIDAGGRILGINTSGIAPGTALTIPTSLAWQVAAALAQNGRLRRGYLGVRSQPVELTSQMQSALGREQSVGLLMVGVDRDSPAASGGMIVGDILVGLNGQAITDPDELVSRLTGSLVGNPTPVEIMRGGQPKQLTITIGERK